METRGVSMNPKAQTTANKELLLPIYPDAIFQKLNEMNTNPKTPFVIAALSKMIAEYAMDSRPLCMDRLAIVSKMQREIKWLRIAQIISKVHMAIVEYDTALEPRPPDVALPFFPTLKEQPLLVHPITVTFSYPKDQETIWVDLDACEEWSEYTGLGYWMIDHRPTINGIQAHHYLSMELMRHIYNRRHWGTVHGQERIYTFIHAYLMVANPKQRIEYGPSDYVYSLFRNDDETLHQDWRYLGLELLAAPLKIVPTCFCNPLNQVD